MERLAETTCIDTQHLDLLEAAGYTEINQLSHTNAHDLEQELAKANRLLEVIESAPSFGAIERWYTELFPAQEDTFSEEFVVETSSGVQAHAKLKSLDQLAAELTIAPSGLQLLPEEIDELDTSLLPIAEAPSAESTIYICKQTGIPSPKQDVSIDLSKVKRKEGSFFRAQQAMGIENDTPTATAEGGTLPKRKSTAEPISSSPEPTKSSGPGEFTSIAKPQASSHSTIPGVKPRSPGNFYFAGLVTVLAMLSFYAGVVSICLLPVLEYRVELFIAPAIAACFGLLYFFVAFPTKCPVCHHKHFVPKGRKLANINAHKTPIIGYLLPTALHLTFKRWCRCIFCGSSIKTKD